MTSSIHQMKDNEKENASDLDKNFPRREVLKNQSLNGDFTDRVSFNGENFND